MRRSRSLTLLLGFISGIAASSLWSCAGGPKVRVEISTPASGGVNYYDERTGERGFTPYSGTDRHVCFSPDDLQAILNYCGSK